MLTRTLAHVLLAGLAAIAESQQVPYRAPVHTLDLSVPPEHRYDQLVPLYRRQVGVLLDGFKDKMPAIVFRLLTDITADLERFIGEPYAAEMRGLARVSGYSLGDVALLNLFYELSAGCTSIVVRNSLNGSATHGRNLDFPIRHLGPVTLDLRVVRSNGSDPATSPELYRYTTFAGYIGVLTGMKPVTGRASGWTFSLDQRFSDDPFGEIWSLYEALLLGGRVTGLLVRELMDATGTPGESGYGRALNSLSETHLTARSYLILGSSNGGAVITRDRSKAVNIWTLTANMTPPALVETNFDHWKPSGDGRRAAAYNALKTVPTGKLGPGSLVSEVLTLGPVHNYETVYTTAMELQTDTYYTLVWQTGQFIGINKIEVE